MNTSHEPSVGRPVSEQLHNLQPETQNPKLETQHAKPFDLSIHYTALHHHPNGRLRDALQLMEEQLAYNWQVEELAATIGISDRHLRRLFSRLLDWCPMEYLCELRLAHAAQSLVTTLDMIEQIAAHVGYVDPHAFRRAFKRSYNLCPTDYRQLHHVNLEVILVAPTMSENTPLSDAGQLVR